MNIRRIVSFAAFATLAAFPSAANIRAVTPCPPDAGWTQSWWMPRHNQKMEQARAGGAPVVFVGDSITHNWESAGKEQWNKYFAAGRYRALNLGFSGDRTEHVLWRLDHGELSGYEAKAVVLMIGTNNTGHFPYGQEPPLDTIIGVRAVLDKIREKQPNAKIVFCPIFPRGADEKDACRVRNRVVNAEVMRFADGKTVFWCDFTDQFLTKDACRVRNRVVNAEVMRFADGKTVFWCDFTDQFLAKDGTLPVELFPDRLHPAAAGYEIWAAAIRPYLDAALDGTPMPPNRFAADADPYARRSLAEKSGGGRIPRCGSTRSSAIATRPPREMVRLTWCFWAIRSRAAGKPAAPPCWPTSASSTASSLSASAAIASST